TTNSTHNSHNGQLIHTQTTTNKQHTHTPFTQPRSHLITNHRWQTQTALITPTSTTKQTPNQTPTDQLSRVMQSRARQSRAEQITLHALGDQ
ncbi:hypothetical protein, partial [Acinetobacter baumannii]|uniref:hypothetical protein n=1 Tax=Acinetobacter baumannii TaxID=470 RepID=UPI00339A56E1